MVRLFLSRSISAPQVLDHDALKLIIECFLPRSAWESVKGTSKEEAWAKYVEKLREVNVFVQYPYSN